MKPFLDIYRDACRLEASDIHLVHGKPIQFRVHGELQDYGTEILGDRELKSLIDQVTTPQGRTCIDPKCDACDYAFQFDAHERLRINVGYERGHLALSARIIRANIPSFEEIGLGATEESLTRLNNGLVIVCGPTGSGKSTTLASLLERINRERRRKIITVEDPIEYVFEHKSCIVEQREIGVDVPSFGSALRSIFRQDPDVIMVGEMRDKETVQETLRIAETGHLVFSTLHTSGAAAAVLRIIDIFEPHEQREVRIQLAENLRAVIFQQLLPDTDGRRVVAREIMLNNSAVSNIIRNGNLEQLKTVIQTSSDQGMVTMDKALERLLRAQRITQQTHDQWRWSGTGGVVRY